MQQAPQQTSELVPTRFVWPYGGRQVHVCGSFTNWLTPIPMAPDGTGGGKVFAVVCNLPPGYHQYKFIVDGKWQHEEGQAFVTDPLGNTNNWLFVKRPEPAAQPASPWAAAPRAAPSDDTGASGMDWAAAATTPGGGGDAITSSPLAAGGVGAPPAASPGGLSRTLGAAAVSMSEADASRSRVLEFLQRHTAYELLPESSKVVVLDTGLPVRQAFHALYEQNVHTAPLWDPGCRAFVGMISPGDFIALLCRLQSLQAGGAGAQGGLGGQGGAPPTTLSELELDGLTIDAWMRDTAAESGVPPHQQPPPQLVSVSPEDSLHSVAHALLRSGSGSLPMLSSLASSSTVGGTAAAAAAAAEAGSSQAAARGPAGVPQLLHLCSLSGVLACLMRHFRGVPGALPLLSQPLGALPIGTWVDAVGPRQTDGGRQGVPHRPLVTMHPSTPLKTALAMLLQAGVGALPIVDDSNCLLDVYARNDILALARNNAYSQLPLDSISVSQALHFMKAGAAAAAATAGGADLPAPGDGAGGRRCYTCTRADTLRTAMETLALPGVMRLVCVQPGTQRIEGIITLTDVASFLFL